jgi:hypothetical protein
MFKSSKSQTITTISITKNVSIKWKNKFTKINESINIVVIQSSVMWVILRWDILFVYPNCDCAQHWVLGMQANGQVVALKKKLQYFIGLNEKDLQIEH